MCTVSQDDFSKELDSPGSPPVRTERDLQREQASSRTNGQMNDTDTPPESHSDHSSNQGGTKGRKEATVQGRREKTRKKNMRQKAGDEQPKATGEESTWETLRAAADPNELIPPLAVLAVVLGISYLWAYASLEPLVAVYSDAHEWTGPVLPLFIIEVLLGTGLEIADWRGAINLPVSVRDGIKTAFILTGTLGTVAAFIVDPSTPFGVALHSTAIGVGSGLTYHFYQLGRSLWFD